MMTGPGVLKYRDPKVPRQDGEYARIRVLQGPDQGAIFVIRQSEVLIGRGREAQVRVADSKASRTHGRLYYTEKGWRVEDLGSANGILFDGEFVRSFGLASGDHFTVGESLFQFLTSEESNQMLMAPIVDDPDVQQKEIVLAQQKLRVRGIAQGVRLVPRKGTKKNQPLLLILVALGAAASLYPEYSRPILNDLGLEFVADLILDPVPATPRNPALPKQKREENTRRLSSYGAIEVAPEAMKTSDQYYKEGFREYRAGNHLRARALLQLALQVNPANEKARYHLAAAEHENEVEIKRLLARGKQLISIGRFREARAYLESALRRTGGDDQDPYFVECTEALKSIESGGKS